MPHLSLVPDPLPPEHGEPRGVGAVAGNETLALARPSLPLPVAYVLDVCERCWYKHDPAEECRR